MCETLNNQLKDGRDKAIILFLEYCREYIMKRHAIVAKMISSSQGPLTPNATLMFEQIKKDAAKYKAIWNGGTKFQVVGPWMDQCVVDMADKTCTCRKWELTGMPCKHAVCTFWDMARNQMEVGLPESYVNPACWLKTWERMYSFTIGPTRGRAFWVKSSSTLTILPPKEKVPIGRPKKKRRRSAIEIQLIKEGKLTRAGTLTKCGKCKQVGHNTRTCTLRAGSSRSGGSRGGGSRGGGSRAAGSRGGGSGAAASNSGGSNPGGSTSRVTRSSTRAAV